MKYPGFGRLRCAPAWDAMYSPYVADLEGTRSMSAPGETLRERLDRAWERLDKEALALKDPHQATALLVEMYQGLGLEERTAAAEVVATWILAANLRQRYDAMALVRRFNITTALPSLRHLLVRLASEEGVESRYEFGMVAKLIKLLEPED